MSALNKVRIEVERISMLLYRIIKQLTNLRIFDFHNIIINLVTNLRNMLYPELHFNQIWDSVLKKVIIDIYLFSCIILHIYK